MIQKSFRTAGVSARSIGKLREYINRQNSESLGHPWGHKTVSYELYYPDRVITADSFADVEKTIKEKGETTSHVTYYESQTGRKLRFDTTTPGQAVVTVDNGRWTDSVVKVVAEIMSLSEFPRRVFITHGHGSSWREVRDYVERDLHLGLETIEMASRPNMGRTLIEKLEEESVHCSFAVVVMTGDDLAGDEVRARENVIHEIGFFQGRYGRGRVCLLHEEGVGIPSNLSGVGYSPFQKGNVGSAFVELQRELRAAFPIQS